MAVFHTFIFKGGYKTKELTGMSAIRQKCLECCAWHAPEVRKCTATDCALYPFRFGRYPEPFIAINAFCTSSRKSSLLISSRACCALGESSVASVSIIASKNESKGAEIESIKMVKKTLASLAFRLISFIFLATIC